MPAVTPEMLEKARQFYAQDIGIGAANYATEAGRLEGQVRYRIELMARFAASAVQDAVRECILICEAVADNLATFHSTMPAGARQCAAALREKYGVPSEY